MAEFPRSDELDALAAELRAMPHVDVPAGLRSRVLAGVGDELQRARRTDRWMFARGVAAAFVLWINLSWTASRDTSFTLAARDNLDARAAQIEALALDISPHEARRQALLLSIGGLYPAVEQNRPVPKLTARNSL